MENQELHLLCKSFLESSLLLLNKKVNTGKIPGMQREIYFRKYDESSKIYNLKSEIVLVPDFDKLTDNYKNEIEELSQFIDCRKLLVKLNINKDNHETIYLFSFLKYYLQINQSLNFNVKIFNKIYSGVENFIFHNKINIKHVFPLKNFKSDVDEIDLGGNIKIKKLTEKDFDEIFKETKRGISYFSSDEAMDVDYQIEAVESIENGTALDNSMFAIICYNVISALRLFKDGIIGDVKLYEHNYVKYKYESWEPIWQPVRGSITMVQQIKAPQKYSLLSQEVGDLIKLWNKYNSYDFNKNRSVDIAIRRFNYAYEKKMVEDKLIDYIITLEALFLKEEENNELNYRIALRTALFIGSKKQEINQIRENIKKAYDIRSKIVHGSSKIKHEKLQELTYKMEEYDRLSIRKFLFLNKGTKEEIEKIEKDIL
jgi:hypothetical protein